MTSSESHVGESRMGGSRTHIRPREVTCYTFPAQQLLRGYSPLNELLITGEAGMPATPHTEHHFTAPESVRDVVIGMSDGLTVPFALAAGISGAIASNPHA